MLAPPVYNPHAARPSSGPALRLPGAHALAGTAQAKLPILPPPPPARSGVIQRLRGVDLAEASTLALGYAGVKAATEVQGLHVDGSIAMTANQPKAMDGISVSQLEELLVPLSRFGPKVTTLKGAVTEGSCATKLAAKDHSLVILNAATVGGELHAEQRLLIVLAYMLKASQVPQTIHVWGAKPPCTTCRGVLQAFNKALNNVYEKTIIFSGEKGEHLTTAVSLQAIFGDPGGDFGRFIAQYETG